MSVASDAPLPVYDVGASRDAYSGQIDRFPPGVVRTVSESLRSGVHIFRCDTFLNGIAASTFLICLLLRELSNSNSVWISQETELHEHGTLYGEGLGSMGLPLSRMLFVQCKTSQDTLWSIEKILESGVFGVIVGELRNKSQVVDVRATRRLALRANAKRLPVYLLVSGPVGPTAALTCWTVEPVRTSRRTGEAIANWPGWHVSLKKNKKGPCGDQILAFDWTQKRFLAAHPAADRTDIPKRPALRSHSGKVMPLHGILRRPLKVDPR